MKQETIYHTQNCPVYLALNGQWSSSSSPFCNCGADYRHTSVGSNTPPYNPSPKIEVKPNETHITDKLSANSIPCFAPSHTWRFVPDTSSAMYKCENCGLRVI